MTMPKNEPRAGEIWWRDGKRFHIELVQDGVVSFGKATYRTTNAIHYYLKDDTPREHLPIHNFVAQFEPPCSFDPDSPFPYREGTCDACGMEGVPLAYHTYVKHDDGSTTSYFICEHCWTHVPVGKLGDLFDEQIRLRNENRVRPTVWDKIIG
jgi:hypothetical protein